MGAGKESGKIRGCKVRMRFRSFAGVGGGVGGQGVFVGVVVEALVAERKEIVEWAAGKGVEVRFRFGLPDVYQARLKDLGASV